jgi:hypothetical protein
MMNKEQIVNLRLLRERWNNESKGGIDPYEVDKFLDWLEANATPNPLTAKQSHE